MHTDEYSTIEPLLETNDNIFKITLFNINEITETKSKSDNTDIKEDE